MLKYVFFDFDDTLYFTHKAKRDSLKHCLSNIANVDFYRQSIFMLQKARKSDLLLENPLNLINIFASFEGKNTPSNISDCYKKYKWKFFELLERNDKVFHHMETVKSVNPNVKFVILTNNYLQTVMEVLEKNRELNNFDSIISPEFFGAGKSGFYYQAVLQLYGINATDCVMVGDNDLTDGSCVDVGIKFINVKEFQKFGREDLNALSN